MDKDRAIELAREAVEAGGGVEKMRRDLETHQAVSMKYSEDYERIKETYPDRWIVMTLDGVAGESETLDGVMEVVRELGLEDPHYTIEYVESNPIPMIATPFFFC